MPVLSFQRIVLPLPACLFVKGVVLDIAASSPCFKVFIVLLAAVAGVGREACGQAPDPLLGVLAARDGAGRVYYMRRSKAIL